MPLNPEFLNICALGMQVMDEEVDHFFAEIADL